MKSVKTYIHFVWMFLFMTQISNAQEAFNPYGYATTVKEAIKVPANVSTLSIYYTRGLIFDVEVGKVTADAPLENLSALGNLRECRINGCPVGFNQEKFFSSLSTLEHLEKIELRMSLKSLGILTNKSISSLKKMKNLRRLNLPHQYPMEEIEKLQEALPQCEIIVNLYQEGE